MKPTGNRPFRLKRDGYSIAGRFPAAYAFRYADPGATSRSLKVASGWMERQLRPPDEGKWIECRNLALATRVGDPSYPYQLTVAINWDGPVEAEDSGLAGAHDLVAGELTVGGLCLHAFTFKAELEWDLVFYTQAPGVALGIVERLGQRLPQATLIPETTKDPSWQYYRERQRLDDRGAS